MNIGALETVQVFGTLKIGLQIRHGEVNVVTDRISVVLYDCQYHRPAVKILPSAVDNSPLNAKQLLVKGYRPVKIGDWQKYPENGRANFAHFSKTSNDLRCD